MSKYHAIIVDDDPISQKIASQCLNRSNAFETPTILCDALSLQDELKKNEYDVIFLDVELPELSGLDFIKAFEQLPRIVLMSSMTQYAVDAFEVEVLDFLPKPIDYARFLKTLNKIDKSYEQPSVPASNTQIADESESIYFKVNGKLVKTRFKDILFCESMSDYVKIYTEKNMLLVLQTMSNLQKSLPNNFVRCHRSYIVNLNKVEAMDDRVLEIKDKAVPVSRSYYHDIKSKLKIIG